MKSPVQRSLKKLLKETDGFIARCSSMEETFGPDALAGLKERLQAQRVAIVEKIGMKKEG